MEQNTKDNYPEVKVILLGDSGVGKTSLINVTMGEKFNPDTKLTITNCYSKKIFNINSKDYQINLWDTAGQEKYRQLAKIFYKGADIIIFVFDISRKQSFEALEGWIKEVKELVNNEYIWAIVGNKNDLYYLENTIKDEEVIKYAQTKENMKFKLVSAKDDPKTFIDFLEELLKDSLKNIEKKIKSITLEKKKNKKHKCKC